MTIRTAFIGAATLILSGSSANAQGQAPQRVVLSEAVMKSMVANKPKSKAPLTARLGVARRASVAARMPSHAAPTWVREIRAAAKKK